MQSAIQSRSFLPYFVTAVGSSYGYLGCSARIISQSGRGKEKLIALKGEVFNRTIWHGAKRYRPVEHHAKRYHHFGKDSSQLKILKKMEHAN
ncbi:hypothetical protein C5167_028997 [Papaver somniferum]|nr:hypothetical protein C5167_028997 [Papaver somniferum]